MTKKLWILPASLGILAVLIAVGWLMHDRLGASMLGSQLSADGTLTVGVPALATDPASYRGELRVIGIVAQVLPEKHSFSLADLRCRKKVLAGHDAGCMTVPVLWKGPMPKLHGDVVVEGKVERLHQKLIFIATDLKKIPLKRPSAGA